MVAALLTNKVYTTYSASLIKNNKARYLSSLKVINDAQIGCKAYWSKYTLIPPIILNNNFITNVSEKAHLFNEFFVDQCKTRSRYI